MMAGADAASPTRLLHRVWRRNLCRAPWFDANAGVAYFPAGEFSDLESFDAGLPKQLSDYLAAAGEPVIFADASTQFAVRLTIQAAFTGSIVIRVEEKSDGRIIARFKKFGHPRRNCRAPLIAQGTVHLTSDAVRKLRLTVEQQAFWSVDDRQDTIGSDGSDWVLEVKDGGRYHVAHRWWPFSGLIFEIGSVLMTLTHVHFVDR